MEKKTTAKKEPKEKTVKTAKAPRAKAATTRAKKKTEETPTPAELSSAVAAGSATPEIVAVAAESTSETAVEPGTMTRGLGRRKTAVARVHVTAGKGTITVNRQPAEKYFVTFEQRNAVTSPLKTVGMESALNISVTATGGGRHSQAEAVRLGISRALIQINPAYRKTLKKLGYLTRDPRAKERKKPGLKRARRAPQWSKR